MLKLPCLYTLSMADIFFSNFWFKLFPFKSRFGDDGTQNVLVFQLFFKYFKTPATSEKVIAWKFKDFSEETIKPPATYDNSLNPWINYNDNAKIQKK